MAIKKSDIYRSLWESCDQLRGGMDASLYKNYILTLLFLKYVSDRAGQPDALIDIPQGCSWQDIRRLRGTRNIGEEMDKIIAGIAEANDLGGVIDRAFFNDPEKFGKGAKMVATLTRLIDIFSREELDFSRNRAGGDDILGDAYEYLMRNFATESGKSKGQFYTPAEVSRVVAAVAGCRRITSPKQSVYDPTCGSGSLLLKAAEASPVALSIYGQEMDITTRGLAVMNMILHGQETAEIAQGDVLAEPEFTMSDTEVMRHDVVVANPPFSLKAWANGFATSAADDVFGRFSLGVLPEKNGDFAFLLHILASMKSTGSGAVVLPHGVLFRGNSESALRQKIVARGYIKGLIGLPANLFYGTGIPATIIVLDKSNAGPERPIFMVDASRGFAKDGNKNRLRECDIHKIIDSFTREIEIPGYSRRVPFEEIARNDYNLNIARYIDSADPEDIQDISAHLHGGIPDRDIDALSDFWSALPGLRNTLFGPSPREDYSDLLVAPADAGEVIRTHPDIETVRVRVHAILDEWVGANAEILDGIEADTAPAKLIEVISEDLLARFIEAPLVDRYAIYQRLMTYWHDVMQDDVFIITGEGWRAAGELREARKEAADEKTGKPKWLEPGDLTLGKMRLVADVIPPDLVVKRFFPEKKAALEEARAHAEALHGEYEALVEERMSEDGLLADALTETGKLTGASIKARLASGEADAEETCLLKQIGTLLKAEAEAKKNARDLDADLTETVVKQYGRLTEEEIHALVVDDKWLTDIADLVDREIESRIETLTARVRVLGERYGQTLGDIMGELEILESRVAGHLAAMGVVG